MIHAAKMVKACTTTILHGFDRWYASVFAQLTIEIGFGIGNRTHTTTKSDVDVFHSVFPIVILHVKYHVHCTH